MPGGCGKDKRQRKLEDCVTPSAPEKGSASAPRRREEMAAKAAGAVQEAVPSGLQVILDEIREFRRDTAQQLGALNIRLDLAQTRADALAQKLSDAEQRVADLENRMAPMEKMIDDYQADIKLLHARQEDAEGRSRRSNLRLVGLPEQIAPKCMATFLEEMLRKLLPQVQLSTLFAIERAHRALGKKPIPGAPPRSVIFKLLNFRDRDAILLAARTAGEIHWEGARVSLYPDLTPAVQKARRQYDTVKAELRKRGMQYSMFHPARLRIAHRNKVFFFASPKDVWAYLESLSANTDMIDNNSETDVPAPGLPSE